MNQFFPFPAHPQLLAKKQWNGLLDFLAIEDQKKMVLATGGAIADYFRDYIIYLDDQGALHEFMASSGSDEFKNHKSQLDAQGYLYLADMLQFRNYLGQETLEASAEDRG